ncbi:hypothetical protein CIPAW_07G036500 [Carya illinoinensis]|uniref:Uncharacterized protein n=1 Tax=Carya illinoinensis TaxID=32201 RepID=A0A8T1PQS5_CARIL|nr:hypothetical protein CIPAW_07G036500 [Carya illinoinensis]
MGNYRQKKSSGFFSVLSAFKPRRARGGEDSVVEEPGSARKVFPSYYENEPGSARKVYPSDYDKKHGMVADHRVDRMAEDFIKRVRKNHITASESQIAGELQTVTVYPGKN